MIESEITSTGGGVTIVIVAGEGVDTAGSATTTTKNGEKIKRGEEAKCD